MRKDEKSERLVVRVRHYSSSVGGATTSTGLAAALGEALRNGAHWEDIRILPLGEEGRCYVVWLQPVVPWSERDLLVWLQRGVHLIWDSLGVARHAAADYFGCAPADIDHMLDISKYARLYDRSRNVTLSESTASNRINLRLRELEGEEQ